MKRPNRTAEEKFALLQEVYPNMNTKWEKTLRIILDLQEECTHPTLSLVSDGKEIECLDCGTLFVPQVKP